MEAIRRGHRGCELINPFGASSIPSAVTRASPSCLTNGSVRLGLQVVLLGDAAVDNRFAQRIVETIETLGAQASATKTKTPQRASKGLR